MFSPIKLKSVSILIGSGITPLRSNTHFWDNGTIPWLKTEQLGENKIYDTTEKITQFAINETSIKIFPVNTISIAMYGEGRTRGNVSILKTAMTTNQACCNIVIDEKKAYENVKPYQTLPFRQEIIINDPIIIINDSKSTNSMATKFSITNMKRKCCLLAGGVGSDDWDFLKDFKEKIIKIFVY